MLFPPSSLVSRRLLFVAFLSSFGGDGGGCCGRTVACWGGDGWAATAKQVAKAQLDEDMCVEAIASYIKAEDPSYYAEVRREREV